MQKRANRVGDTEQAERLKDKFIWAKERPELEISMSWNCVLMYQDIQYKRSDSSLVAFCKEQASKFKEHCSRRGPS